MRERERVQLLSVCVRERESICTIREREIVLLHYPREKACMRPFAQSERKREREPIVAIV